MKSEDSAEREKLSLEYQVLAPETAFIGIGVDRTGKQANVKVDIDDPNKPPRRGGMPGVGVLYIPGALPFPPMGIPPTITPPGTATRPKSIVPTFEELTDQFTSATGSW